MDEVTQIRVGGVKVGLIGLTEVFAQVRGESHRSDASLAERLVDLVSKKNYVADSRRAEYGASLLREYRRFCGEDLPPDLPEGIEIRVLGMGCAACERLAHEVRSVLQELGVEADMEQVKDVRAIATYGPVATPALVINGRVVVSGRVPPKERIIQILKENVR